MARIRLLHSIHAQSPYGIDRERVECLHGQFVELQELLKNHLAQADARDGSRQMFEGICSQARHFYKNFCSNFFQQKSARKDRVTHHSLVSLAMIRVCSRWLFVIERIFFESFDIRAELEKSNFSTQDAPRNRKNILY